MTQQEIIERDVRLLIGDLHLQLVMARAQIATLEQQRRDRDLDKQPGHDPYEPNGKGKPEETPPP